MSDIDIKNEIKSIIYESGHTVKEVAYKLGMSTTNLSNMLSRRSIRYDVAKKIADSIGYELKFRRSRDE
jgi:lambda repressor-like predicted transcriptional regulator